MKSVLIILDLNGILGNKVFTGDVAKGKITLPPTPEPDRIVFFHSKWFSLRPGIYELLAGLLIHGYDLAIWSSIPNDRVQQITDFLSQQSPQWAELMHHIQFIWGRDQCQIEGYTGIKTIPQFLKQQYQQICIVDDTQDKVKYNSSINYFITDVYDWSIYKCEDWQEQEQQKVSKLMHDIIFFNECIINA